MDKKGKGELETVGGLIVFVVIMFVLFIEDVFSDIIKAFNVPEFGIYGWFLGILFVLIIIMTFLENILGK